ncbi:MAG: hypothetical protein KDN19_02610 [Verrucomicrobiae bacterium]|nr:hypothetical protein [Verrucomicrobiae bacterium]
MKPAFVGIASLFVVSSVASAVEYEKDIMPIFMEKCADCHSNESGKAKGGLKFDDPAHFHGRFEKNSVVVPGDWDASYLFLTLFRPADDKEAMPPKGKGERLTRDEVTLVMQWISEGAPINGERGERGEMPENLADLLQDLPPSAGGTAGTNMKPSLADDALPARPVEQDWTNAEGRTIRAALLGVDGEVALLKTPDGRVHRYPIANLSEESRKKLER